MKIETHSKAQITTDNKINLVIQSKVLLGLYLNTNKQMEKKDKKIYYQKNREKIIAKNKERYNKNREECIKKGKEYYERTKEQQKERRREYALKNKEKMKIYHEQYKEVNKEKMKERRKQLRLANLKTVRKKANKWNKVKYETDPIYRFKIMTRDVLRRAFKSTGYKKQTKTQDILGITIPEFKKYLESLFEPWMSWENKGKYNGTPNFGWDIDHIIPLSSSVSQEEVERLNHYTNLKPLCSYINRDVKKDNLNYRNNE